jgi:hypothetical protein
MAARHRLGDPTARHPPIDDSDAYGMSRFHGTCNDLSHWRGDVRIVPIIASRAAPVTFRR